MRELEYCRVYRGTVAAATRRLRAELSERGFTVLNALSVHGFLARTGRGPVEPVTILDVGSPDLFHRALEISRQAALLLPCKLVISREDGETLIALQRPAYTTQYLLPIPTLLELNDLVERSLAEAIDATVGSHMAANHLPVFVTVDQTVRRLPPPRPSRPEHRAEPAGRRARPPAPTRGPAARVRTGRRGHGPSKRSGPKR